MTTYTLPYPPSVNRHVRADFAAGRVLVSKEWREYRRAVATALLAARPGGEPLSGRLSVEIVARVPDKRRRDLDNVLKAALDALTGILYHDDSQIDYLSIKRDYADDKLGQLVVTLSSCDAV